MLSNTLAALSLLPFAFAHFELKYPATRGFNEDSEGNFPCGGYNDVSSQRVDFPMSGGPIQISVGHTQTNVAVYMAVGENPGDGFSVVLRPQLQVTGLGDFCIGDIQIPSNLNISDGTPASIQVITNAHGDGGLYQCSDVKLVSTQLSESDINSNCKNNTGIKVSQENISGNPNGTSSEGGSSASGTSGTSGAAASPTSSPAAAPAQAKVATWVLGAVGLAGMAML